MSSLINDVGILARIPQEHNSVQLRRLVYGLIQAIGDYPVDSQNLKLIHIKEARQKLASRITEEEITLPTEKSDDPQPQEPVKAKEEGEENEEIKSGGTLQALLLSFLFLIASVLVVVGIRKKVKENRRLNKTDIKKSPDLEKLVPPRRKENFTSPKLAQLFAAERGKPLEFGDFYIPNTPPSN